jgi:hypothetical protein
MRYFLLIPINIFVFSGSKNEVTIQSSKFPEGLILITKTETGFNKYSNTGELLLEYTKQNCDSLSLKTLDDIYFTAKEFYNKKSPAEKQEIIARKIKLEGLYVER